MIAPLRADARSLRSLGPVIWLLACAAALLNWSRHGLTAEAMNPMQGQRLAVLWLAALLIAVLWVGRRASWVPGAVALLLSAMTLYPLALWPLALLTVSVCLWSVRVTAPAWLLTVPLAFAASLLGAYERLFGSLSAESASTLYQTAPFELLSYLLHLITLGLLVNWALFAGSLWLFARRAEPAAEMRTAAGPLVVASIPSLLICAPALLERGLALKLGFAVHRAQQRTAVPGDALAPRQAQPGIDVFWVIGESSSRWRWQLYGYPRP